MTPDPSAANPKRSRSALLLAAAELWLNWTDFFYFCYFWWWQRRHPLIGRACGLMKAQVGGRSAFHWLGPLLIVFLLAAAAAAKVVGLAAGRSGSALTECCLFPRPCRAARGSLAPEGQTNKKAPLSLTLTSPFPNTFIFAGSAGGQRRRSHRSSEEGNGSQSHFSFSFCFLFFICETGPWDNKTTVVLSCACARVLFFSPPL